MWYNDLFRVVINITNREAASNMDIIKAISTRRSYGAVLDKDVSNDFIEEILQAASWAPNHKRTEPWSFHVFKGDGRHKLAAAIAEQGGEEGYKKVFRAPVVIAVVSTVGRGKINPPIWEDHAATAAAIQNMALATHSLGLAGYWRTGVFTEHDAVKKLLAVDDNKGDRVMAFFYLGYPDTAKLPPLRNKPNWQSKTIWY